MKINFTYVALFFTAFLFITCKKENIQVNNLRPDAVSAITGTSIVPDTNIIAISQGPDGSLWILTLDSIKKLVNDKVVQRMKLPAKVTGGDSVQDSMYHGITFINVAKDGSIYLLYNNYATHLNKLLKVIKPDGTVKEIYPIIYKADGTSTGIRALGSAIYGFTFDSSGRIFLSITYYPDGPHLPQNVYGELKGNKVYLKDTRAEPNTWGALSSGHIAITKDKAIWIGGLDFLSRVSCDNIVITTFNYPRSPWEGPWLNAQFSYVQAISASKYDNTIFTLANTYFRRIKNDIATIIPIDGSNNVGSSVISFALSKDEKFAYFIVRQGGVTSNSGTLIKKSIQ